MNKPGVIPISTACCPKHSQMQGDVKCLMSDMCDDLQKLAARHQNMFTKRRRLLALAVPRTRNQRYVPKCACKFVNCSELVHLEQRVRTRTEQLAYPQARKLLLFRSEVAKKFPQDRLAALNRLTRTSLLSMYSRLENVQPPQKRVRIHKWDSKEWKKHLKYLRKLAKHKVSPKVPKIPKTAMPFSEMRRYKKLSKPKKREVIEKQEWVLTPEVKFYQPSERVLKISKPRMFNNEAMFQTLPVKVPLGVLKYKATKRILELATAMEQRVGESEIKDNPFSVAPNALKAKASQRLQDLAEPKEFENVHIRDNPNAISPAALKAKASPRIIELAKPKGS